MADAAAPDEDLVRWRELGLKALMDSDQFTIAVLDDQLRVRWVSENAKEYGVEPGGLNLVELLHPDDMEIALAAMSIDRSIVQAQDFGSAKSALVTVRILTRSGYVPFEVSGVLSMGPNDAPVLTVLLRPENLGARTAKVLRLMATGSSLDVLLPAVAEAFEAQLGTPTIELVVRSERGRGPVLWTNGPGPSSELRGFELLAAIGANDRVAPWTPIDLSGPTGEEDYGLLWPISDSDGLVGAVAAWGVGSKPSPQWVDTVIAWLRDLVAIGFRRSLIEEDLRHQAATDHLTGLLSRRAFLDAADDPITGSQALLYLDLDSFKEVNDRYGHLVGDAVLAAIGSRLNRTIRPGDKLARLGGDEFTVLCHDVGVHEAMVIAHRLIYDAAQPVRTEYGMISVSASVGIAVAHENEPFTDLMRRADQALYEAKSQGRNRAVLAELPTLTDEQSDDQVTTARPPVDAMDTLDQPELPASTS